MMTMEEVFHALTYLRDTVLTDENMTTTKGVIEKMSTLLVDIYDWVTRNNIQDLTVEDEGSRTIIDSIIKKNPMWDRYESQSRGLIQVSLSGVLEALEFIRKHMKQGDDILADIFKVLDSFTTIMETRNSRALYNFDDPKIQDLYTELLS